jgi:uncharacterized membrane protein
MKQDIARQALVAAALASLAVVAPQTQAAHADKKVQCYGISKAGQNDCASKTGVHGCATEAKVDNDKGDFKNVPEGTCKKLGGTVDG